MKLNKIARAATLPLALAACSPASQSASSGLPAPADEAMKTSAAISEADLKERLYALADDSMIGRATGTIGHIKVTEHIAAEMKRLGLQPGGENGTYFQTVPFVKRALQNATISVDGTEFKVWDDFIPIHPGAAFRSIDGAQVV